MLTFRWVKGADSEYCFTPLGHAQLYVLDESRGIESVLFSRRMIDEVGRDVNPLPSPRTWGLTVPLGEGKNRFAEEYERRYGR